jgi:hypothetical protein
MIPKIIHQIWVGGQPMPARLNQYRQSWATHHPGWEIRLWTDANRPKLQNESLWATAPHPAAKSDLLRYELLRQFGGLYVDVDFECLRNVEPLLAGAGTGQQPGQDQSGQDQQFILAYENPRHLQIGFIASTPNHPALTRIIQEHRLRWQQGVTDPFLSGPILIDHLRRDPSFDAMTTKLLPGLIGATGQDSYAAHRSLASWRPSTQILHRATTYSESAWGSHLPLLAGLWRRVPGEVVVEAGIGPYSTPFLVNNSLHYTGIETDREYCVWAGIQFRDDKHVKIIPSFLPEGIPFQRGECTPAQITVMDDAMSCAAHHCPQKIDVLMVDCFGAARSSAIKTLAARATTVVMHDTECWVGYHYGEVVGKRAWRHRFSIRPVGLPWADAVTSYPVDAADVKRVIEVCARQFWPPQYQNVFTVIQC